MAELDASIDRAVNPPLRTARRVPVLLVTVVLVTVTNAVAFMMPPLLPLIEAHYRIGVSGATWIFTAMTLGGGAGFVLIPRLSDVRGDRATCVMSGITMTLGALIVAIGDSYVSLIIGGVLMGFGSASQMLPLSYVRRCLPGDVIGLAVRLLILSTGSGVVLGMVGGGYTVEHLSLVMFFYILAGAFAATTVALAVVVPASRPVSSMRLGVLGTLWMIAWVALVLLGLSQVQVWGRKAYFVLFVGAVVGAVWVHAQQRSASALFEVNLLRRPYMTTSCVAVAAFGAVDSALLLLVAYYTQTPKAAGYGLGMSALQTSLLMLPFALTMFIGGSAAEKVIARGRPSLVFLVGGVTCAVGLVWLAFAHEYSWQYLIGAGLVGLGSRAGYSGGLAVPQLLVPQDKAGMAAGMVGTTMAIGFAFGTALVIAILSTSTIGGTGLPVEGLYTTGYLAAFVLPVVVVVASGISAWRHGRDFNPLSVAAPNT